MVDKGGQSTSYNKYSWNNNANVIFLDQVCENSKENPVSDTVLTNWWCFSLWMLVTRTAEEAPPTRSMRPSMSMLSFSFSSRNSPSTRRLISMLLASHVSNLRLFGVPPVLILHPTHRRCRTLHSRYRHWAQQEQQGQVHDSWPAWKCAVLGSYQPQVPPYW